MGLLQAMEEEVNALCGQKHHPNKESSYRRAGSEQGSAYLADEKEPITRPRVRHVEDGEVQLNTYKAASSQRNLFDSVVRSVAEGLSIRGKSRSCDNAVSKSSASRMWVEKSREQLEILRNRPLSDTDWVCVMLDGVWLTKELCVVIAIGIDTEGVKKVLDFEQGCSENKTVVEDLLIRLRHRGLEEPADRSLLVLRDGSQAIAKAVATQWPNALQQECLVHVQRNVRDKVPKRYRAEVDCYFKQLRQAQGKEAGEEAFDELVEFLAERNAAAALNLNNRRDVLLSFHRLDVSSTLNTTFLSTNIIENAIRNWREATNNVKRWRENEDMVARWCASGLLWCESGFRKIRHSEDLPTLAVALSSSPPSPSLRSGPGSEEHNARLEPVPTID